MISTLIICLTIIFCVIWVTLWIKHMVSKEYPLFTYARCTYVPDDGEQSDEKPPIGFISEAEEEDVKSKDLTEKEQKEALMRDPITLTAALLRGEVDIDEIHI